MANSTFKTTVGHIVKAVEHLGLDADTPVEITVKLSKPEKIARLNALLKEGNHGEAMPREPLDERLERLHAPHPRKA